MCKFKDDKENFCSKSLILHSLTTSMNSMLVFMFGMLITDYPGYINAILTIFLTLFIFMSHYTIDLIKTRIRKRY